jgi:hypothetical protein
VPGVDQLYLCGTTTDDLTQYPYYFRVGTYLDICMYLYLHNVKLSCTRISRNINACIYIYIHIYIYTINICIYVYMHTYAHLNKFMNIFLNVRIDICLFRYVYNFGKSGGGLLP